MNDRPQQKITQTYSRRQIAGLGLVIAVGAGVSVALRRNADLGVDISGRPIAAQVHTDRLSPQLTPPQSDLTLAVFSDYRCPVCRRSDAALSAVLARNPDLRVIFKEWPIFGEPSRRAAIVALMADRQAIYRPVRKALLEAPSFGGNVFQEIVERAGGEWEPIAEELDKPGTLTLQQLQRAQNDAFALGLAGTPSYLVGPILVEGSLGERQLEKVIAQAREAQARDA